MLTTDDTSPLTKLAIAPSFGQIANIAEQIHTAKISECLAYFAERVRFKHDLYTLNTAPAQHAQALLVDAHAPQMALKDKFVFCCAPISINVNIEKDYFLMCLQSAYLLAPRALPKSPVWLKSDNPKHLEEAENLSQNISLYAWLSYKFPAIFVELDAVSVLRTQVSRYIERSLLTQAGYGETSRELDLAFR
jgi:ATP-dependent RNA helicase SUPV3L1/SUV3